MTAFVSRAGAAVMALVVVALLLGAAKPANVVAPDKLVILSTVDVKGRPALWLTHAQGASPGGRALQTV